MNYFCRAFSLQAENGFRQKCATQGSPVVVSQSNLVKTRFLGRLPLLVVRFICHWQRSQTSPDSKCDCILKMVRFQVRNHNKTKKALQVECFRFVGDPYGNRTHDSALRGLRLSRLTNGPFVKCSHIIAYVFLFCNSFLKFFRKICLIKFKLLTLFNLYAKISGIKHEDKEE